MDFNCDFVCCEQNFKVVRELPQAFGPQCEGENRSRTRRLDHIPRGMSPL